MGQVIEIRTDDGTLLGEIEPIGRTPVWDAHPAGASRSVVFPSREQAEEFLQQHADR